MAWTKDNSQERVRKIAEETVGGIAISDLTRQMNLSSVKLRSPKRIAGVHLYQGPANEEEIVDSLISVDDPEPAQRCLQQIHLFQREAGRIIGEFDVAAVHFQGTRLHALSYRPAGDQGEVVVRSVLLALAIDHTARGPLGEILPDAALLDCCAGAAYGSTVATMSGPRAEAELLFIGNAANLGAKLIDPARHLRVDGDLLELLDTERYGVDVADLGDGTFGLGISIEALEENAASFGSWNLPRSRQRLEEDLERLPLETFSISKATAEIDKDRLGPSNGKLNDAATSFADLDGFTAIVERAESDSEVEELVRAFHVTRYELNYVRKDDYPGTFRVQYQGDRVQTLRHLPHDDARERVIAALQVAAGWQSSMRETLPEATGRDDLRLAIGVAAGPTIVSKLGTTGNRDVLALGPEVRAADGIQHRLDADQVGISKEIYQLVPEPVNTLFEWNAGALCYVAKDLRVNQLEYALQAAALDAGEALAISSGEGRHRVGTVGVAAAGAALGATAVAVAAARRKQRDVRPKPRWSY